MNDQRTLHYYTELWDFRKDEHREIIIFPNTMPPEERRIVHVLAQKLGLHHSSHGEGGDRQVHVSKAKISPSAYQISGHLQQPGATLEAHPKGLSRAATYDFSTDARPHLSIQSVNRTTLAVPGSPDGQHALNNLRGVKSFADLRSYSPSPSPSTASNNHLGPSTGHNSGSLAFMGPFGNDSFGVPGLATPNTPGGMNASSTSGADSSILAASMGALGLGPTSSYDVGGSGLSRVSRENIGAIGSQRPGANGAGSRANPERQPRGPAGEWDGGFVGRGRTNGHMQRGSGTRETSISSIKPYWSLTPSEADSSDNTSRLGTTTSGTLY